MTRVIVIGSGKGGVGKTTAVANLSAALTKLGKSVIAIDANTTTSNLCLHVGLPKYPATLQDVLKGRASLEQAIWCHPAGFRIIPADVAISKVMSPKPGQLLDVLNKLIRRTDFVLIDSAAGLCSEALASLRAADELLIVTNPELPALTDALKLSMFAQKYETKNLGVVLNRVNGSHQWAKEEVERFLEIPVIGYIPEDIAVQKAIAKKLPVVLYNPASKSSRQFMNLAAKLAGIEYRPTSAVLHRLFGWLIK
jgi:septum site-determining protein MinD